MPEGNTIHRLARDHTRDFGGLLVRVASPQGRFAREASRLDGRRFREADAIGKHLFHEWEGGLIVHVHLGMAGEFTTFAGTPPGPRPSVRMRLSTPEVTVDLIGPPTCELIDGEKRAQIEARLGPDPLRRGADPARVFAALKKRPDRPIGDALLDQRVISGVGNIYRIEALFLAGIHPLQRSGRISQARWFALWELLGVLMRRGVTLRRSRRSSPARFRTWRPAAGPAILFTCTGTTSAAGAETGSGRSRSRGAACSSAGPASEDPDGRKMERAQGIGMRGQEVQVRRSSDDPGE